MKLNIVENTKILGLGLKSKLIDYAPTILTVVGCVSLIGGTVVACLRTDNLKEINQQRDDILDLRKEEYDAGKVDFKEYRGEVGHAYTVWGWNVFRNYAPAVALEVLGVACILKGHSMMITRYAALGALLTEKIQQQDYLEQRIREVYGDEVYEQLMNGEDIIVEKDGKEEVVSKKDKHDILTDDFSFIWTEGMGDYNPESNASNWQIAKSIQENGNWATRRYGYFAGINDIYRQFGAFHKVRSEYDAACLGWPNVKIKDYPIQLKITEVKGGDMLKAPALKIEFVNKPIVCSQAMINAGYMVS